jgi:hypothetical protein
MTEHTSEPLSCRDSVRRNLDSVLGRREMGWASGNAVVDWAGDALSKGFDSASLRALAGLTSPTNEFEVDALVRAAAAELGFVVPDREKLLRQFATILAEDIVTGRKRPVDGAKELYQVFRMAKSLSDLALWTGLDDAVSLAKNGIYGSINQVEREIVRHAHRMLEGTK